MKKIFSFKVQLAVVGLNIGVIGLGLILQLGTVVNVGLAILLLDVFLLCLSFPGKGSRSDG